MKPQHTTLKRPDSPLSVAGRANLGVARDIAMISTKCAVALWLFTFLLLGTATYVQLTHGDRTPAVYVTAACGTFGLLGIVGSLRLTALAVDDWHFFHRLQMKSEWRG